MRKVANRQTNKQRRKLVLLGGGNIDNDIAILVNTGVWRTSRADWNRRLTLTGIVLRSAQFYALSPKTRLRLINKILSGRNDIVSA